MDEFIEIQKEIKQQGNSWAVFIKHEAEILKLDVGDEIGIVVCRTSDRKRLHDLINGHDQQMYFLSVLKDEPHYDIRKSYSESLLNDSYDVKPITILGPFADPKECIRLKHYLQDNLKTMKEKDIDGLYRRYLSL